MPLSVLSVVSRSAFAASDFASLRSAARSVWYCEYASSTVLTAAAALATCVASQATVVVTFGIVVVVVFGAVVVSGVSVGRAVGDAVGLVCTWLLADGLALAWVRVIVVTPFADDAV